MAKKIITIQPILILVILLCSSFFGWTEANKEPIIKFFVNEYRKFDGRIDESKIVADSLKRTAILTNNPQQYIYSHHILADAYLKSKRYPEALKQITIFYLASKHIGSEKNLAVANWDFINYRMALGDSSYTLVEHLDKSINKSLEVEDTNMAIVFLVSRATFLSQRK